MRTTSWLVIGALCSVVSGCDGCDHHGNPDGGGMNDMAVPIDMTAGPDLSMHQETYSEFAAHYAQALCNRFLACNLIDQASMASCLERNTLKIGWDVDTEILKGRVGINETSCIDAVNKTRCDLLDADAVQATCATAFVPKLAPDAVCLATLECTNGYCAHEGSDAGATLQPDGCPGVCTPFKAPDAPCTSDEQCGSHGTCNVPDSDPAGAPRCLTLLKEGDDCTVFNPYCDPGDSLFCPFYATNIVCTKAVVHAEHDACDPGQNYANVKPCAEGFYCKQGTGNSFTCEKTIDDNTECEYTNAPVSPSCTGGKLCYSVDGQPPYHCQKRGGNNEPCWSFSATSGTCGLGYYCTGAGPGTAGVCKPLIADEQPCTQNFQCASAHPGRDTTCVVANADAGSNMTCQPSKNLGDKCVPGFEDSVCFPSGTAGTSYCATTPAGGSCQPRCY